MEDDRRITITLSGLERDRLAGLLDDWLKATETDLDELPLSSDDLRRHREAHVIGRALQGLLAGPSTSSQDEVHTIKEV